MTPYWEPVEVHSRSGTINEGDKVSLSLKLACFNIPWTLVHQDYIEGKQFCDLQIQGPFEYWKHYHQIEVADDQSAFLLDKIEFKLPLGILGEIFGLAFTETKLARLFRYRHAVTQADLRAEAINKEKRIMKILVTGSSGLVGKDLSVFLEHQGHQVSRLVRNQNQVDSKNVFWDPEHNILDASQIEGFDAVIHLAGENIAAKRWTKAQKEKIKNSRVDSTKLLSETLAKLKNKPKTFISVSAIGFYGDRPDENLYEDAVSVKGDFLAEVCQEWEAAVEPARQAGIRVINPRFGVILSPKGGAMAKLLTPFELGLGGNIGNGEQYMSWIALDDVIYALHYLLMNSGIQGPVNFVSPKPVTNAEFTKILAKVLKRPAIFPLPSFAAKLIFGEMADALLLATAKVRPRVLEESGFIFSYPNLEGALRHLLGRP